MTLAFRKGRYGVRLASGPDDVAACQALRHLCFFGLPGRDADAFDTACRHVMIAGAAGLVATCRLMPLASGAEISRSYAAQHYDLTRLSRDPAPMLEIGRLCVAPTVQDPDVLRLMWAAVTRVVDAEAAGLLFGCASFRGIDPAPYRNGFALLAARHLAPPALAPARRAAQIVPLGPPALVPGAQASLPPLLRSYLGMGGWVSDHAVVDAQMNTLHVFTGVSVAAIPPARARALRAMAG